MCIVEHNKDNLNGIRNHDINLLDLKVLSTKRSKGYSVEDIEDNMHFIPMKTFF